MSYDVVLSRMAQLQSLFTPAAAAPAAPATPAASAAATTPTTPTAFASQLQSASSATMTPAVPAGSAGQAIVNLVRKEVGVAEQPPGSFDSPRIAQFRLATAGSGVGPW